MVRTDDLASRNSNGAHDALRRHGVAVPRAMTKRAKQHVAKKIKQAQVRGAKKISAAATRFAFG
jgi:hypothetical protein